MKNRFIAMVFLMGTLTWMNDCQAKDTKDTAASKPAVTGQKSAQKVEQAMFAAGCFWKVEYIFKNLPGVVKTRVGYSGGHKNKPTYKEVCTDQTGHAEVVMVDYDPAKVSYHKLLEKFFSMHNPTTLNRQGPDVGTQYRSAIFFMSPEQQKEALAYKKQLESEHKFKAPIVTVVEPAKPFFDAEEYHQDYFTKHGKVCY